MCGLSTLKVWQQPGRMGPVSANRLEVRYELQADCFSGLFAHRWAERYDRELHDAFAVQDEVARAIVAILAAHVKRAETEKVLLKPPATWEAYDYTCAVLKRFTCI